MRECEKVITVPRGVLDGVRKKVLYERGLPPEGWYYDVIWSPSKRRIELTGTLPSGTTYRLGDDEIVLAHIEGDLRNAVDFPEEYGDYIFLLDAAVRVGEAIPPSLFTGDPRRIRTFLRGRGLDELTIRERFPDIWRNFHESAIEAYLEEKLEHELACVEEE